MIQTDEQRLPTAKEHAGRLVDRGVAAAPVPGSEVGRPALQHPLDDDLLHGGSSRSSTYASITSPGQPPSLRIPVYRGGIKDHPPPVLALDRARV